MENFKNVKTQELERLLGVYESMIADWGNVYQMNITNWNSGTENDYYMHFCNTQDVLVSELFSRKFQA